MKKVLITTLLSTALLVALPALAQTWNPPQGSPAPACTAGDLGCYLPINVSNVGQQKGGALSILGNFIAGITNGMPDLFVNRATNRLGKVGIGTDAPTADLDVAGVVKIRGGVPGDNKVLASDNTGKASWKTLTELCQATGSCGGNGNGDGFWGGLMTGNINNLNSGNVGIGTGAGAVGEKLTVVGNGLFTGSGMSTYVDLVNNGSEVGLGEAGTDQAAGAALAQVNSGTQTNPGNTTVPEGSGSHWWRLSADALRFRISQVLPNGREGSGLRPRLTIDNAGNVGIGSLIPAAKLDVNGQVMVRGGEPDENKVLKAVNANGLAVWDTLAGIIQEGDNIDVVVNEDNTVTINNTQEGGGIARLDQGEGIVLNPNPITETGTISADFNEIISRLAGACPASQAIQAINSDGAGRVTLGCVEVGGDDGAGDDFWGGSLTGNINNLNSGGVGIGTTNVPADQKFVVDGRGHAGGGNFQIRDGGAIDAGGARVFSNDSRLFLQGGSGSGSGGGIHFRAGDSTLKMLLTPAGNLGIGTPAPGTRLEVNGPTLLNGRTAVTQDLRVATAGSGSSLRLVGSDGINYIQSGNAGSDAGISADLRFGNPGDVNGFVTIQAGSGNVGIGTVAPGQKLDVNGHATVRENLKIEGGIEIQGRTTGGAGRGKILTSISNLGTAAWMTLAEACALNPGVCGGGPSGVTNIIAGDNISISPSSGTGAVTINSTPGSVGLSQMSIYQTAAQSGISSLGQDAVARADCRSEGPVGAGKRAIDCSCWCSPGAGWDLSFAKPALNACGPLQNDPGVCQSSCSALGTVAYTAHVFATCVNR